MKMGKYEVERNFLKSNFYKLKNIKTDKMKGLTQPEGIKRYDPDSKIINLPTVSGDILIKQDIIIYLAAVGKNK